MTLRTFHKTIIKVWAISVLLYAGIIGATGTQVTFNSTIMPLVVLCALPAMALVVFRGAPPRTVAQVIYDEENASAELAKRLLKIERAEELHGPRS